MLGRQLRNKDDDIFMSVLFVNNTQGHGMSGVSCKWVADNDGYLFI